MMKSSFDSNKKRYTSNDKLRRYVYATLIVNVMVILWGAYVRATGSGAGCGNHWPLCDGEILPRAATTDTIIEFAHRLSSGLAFLLVIGLWIWVYRLYAPKHPARSYATLALGFMFMEAMIGAGLVLFDLVAFNTSVVRAGVGALHLLNTFLLLACLTAVIEVLGEDGSSRFVGGGTGGRLLYIGAIGILLVGMSGAIAALGDTLFPSATFLQGVQQEISADAHFLIRLRLWHPVVALLASVFIILGTRLQSSSSGHSTRIQFVLSSLIVLQLIAGAINVLLLAPIWLQIIHLLLADLIWIVLILYLFRTQRQSIAP